MSSRKIKNEIISLLGQSDLKAVLNELNKYPQEDLINSLFSALCRSEELLRWHAVSGFGQVVPKLAEKDMETARIIMRRFIWSLNDESGGIGWGAPEAMGEIMYHHDRLADEYLHMLISYTHKDGPELFQDGNFLELPQLQRGLLWGIGRVAGKRGQALVKRGVAANLVAYLRSDDAMVCAMAIWGLGQLKALEAGKQIKDFLDDKREVVFYFEGQLTTKTVGEFVSIALSKLKNV